MPRPRHLFLPARSIFVGIISLGVHPFVVDEPIILRAAIAIIARFDRLLSGRMIDGTVGVACGGARAIGGVLRYSVASVDPVGIYVNTGRKV